MNLPLRHLFALTLSAVAGWAGAAYAVDALDCEALSEIERNKTYEADPATMRQCIQRGWDPPLQWRPDEGRSMTRAAGAGGFSVSGRNPPNRPPALDGGGASISSSMFNFTLSIPPWRGFPCQLPGGIDLCGGGGGGNGNGSGTGSGTGTGGTGTGGTGGGADGGAASCPVASDTQGTYGEQIPITSSGSQTLVCGGAVPLSTYLMSAVASPIGIIATEAGNRTAWVYRAQGSGYGLVGTYTLPSSVCSNGQAIPIEPPIAQIIPYNSSSGNVAIRLALSANADVADPFDPDPEIEQPYYLQLPLVGGSPQIPTGCPNAADSYRTLSALTAPLTVESATSPGCEGTPEACAGQPTTPVSSSNCNAVTVNPNGDSCEGSTLFAVLNRPNLLYPPSSTARFSTMDGRTAVLAGSSGGMRLYTQAETIMYFGARGGSFTLPEGGTMKLDGGNKLIMNGPATINASGGQVTLSNGGAVIAQDGTTVQNFSNSASYAPQVSPPYVVRVSRSVELPAGLVLPTQPVPFVRLPVQVE